MAEFDETKAHALLRPFEAHGVVINGYRDNQAYGFCPFSGKDDKFYVNVENGLWDSKTAGLSGNLSDFLEAVARVYEEALTPKHLDALAADRRLPVEAFEGWGLGWNGVAYTLPVRDLNGRVVDIRTARLGKAFLSTAGCKVGLLGAERLKKNRSGPVYVCEGEWDTFSLHWELVKVLKEKVTVVGVPGAGTMKPDWVAWLTGRVVHTLYDHDDAGLEAEVMIQKKLGTAATRLTFTHWPRELPKGFDVRDWIIYGAVEREDPDGCWKKMQGLFRPETRRAAAAMQPAATMTIVRKKDLAKSGKHAKVVTVGDLHHAFNKWLLLKNNDLIDFSMAVVLSMRLLGEPLWSFVVGPPGSGKTVVVDTLNNWEHIHVTSSITPHTLVSGASGPGGIDPSLIPRLDGKTLVVKDFTVILGMHEKDKEEIFDILRDAYDGKCAKEFGNGITRRYESRFSILAAVTTAIYDASAAHAALGERFLKFSVGDNIEHFREADVIMRAIDNSMKPTTMSDDVSPLVISFLEERWANAVEPEIPEDFKVQLVALGRFVARMRGTVSREQYNQDLVKSRPSAEVGTRLGIQFAKLMRALAMVYGHEVCGEAEYRIVRKVALDTVTQRTEDFVRAIWKARKDVKGQTTSQEIAMRSHYPVATVNRVLADMHALRVVTKEKIGSYKFTWAISPYIAEQIKIARLYEDAADLERKSVTEELTLQRQEAKQRRFVFTPNSIRVTPAAPRKVAEEKRLSLVKTQTMVVKSKR